MTNEQAINALDNPDLSRYEVQVGPEVAGFAEYRIRGERIFFTHTEVSQDFRGQGLAEVLADFALTDAVSSRLTIVPLCPYIARYLRRHEVAGAIIEWPAD